MLAAVEADLLGDDPALRGYLVELVDLLRCWRTAGDQAVAVHLRLLDPRHDGYVESDRATALADYRFARGLVLTSVQAIHEHLTFEEDA